MIRTAPLNRHHARVNGNAFGIVGALVSGKAVKAMGRLAGLSHKGRRGANRSHRAIRPCCAWVCARQCGEGGKGAERGLGTIRSSYSEILQCRKKEKKCNSSCLRRTK